MKNKFFEIKNLSETASELYIYGEIVGEKEPDFWTGEVSKTEVDVEDFKQALASVPNGAQLNMYVNSPGGSVWATSAICTQLQRAKERGVKIDAYIDGVACSSASFLIMVADNIHIYKNSMVMIHKPWGGLVGNADDFIRQAEMLEKVENRVMLPLYMNKAKCDEGKLKAMLSAETWLNASEIQELFAVELHEEEKAVQNCKSDLFKAYKNAPEEITQEKPADSNAKVDYSYYDNIIKKLGGNQK